MFLRLVIAVLAIGNVLAQTSNQTSLPQYSTNATARAQAIAVKRAGWLYGPGLLNGPFYPAGPLGAARTERDLGLFAIDEAWINGSINADLPAIEAAVIGNGGFHNLADYVNLLYVNKLGDAVPGGEDLGILTNYTEDLLFSMERLSENPYSIRRVKLTDTLPFTIPDSTSISLSSLTLRGLQLSSRLFIVDHSYQAKYPTNARFGGYCTAYFFIDPKSGNFLPLAIKTNIGADLVYTPLDGAIDWLFAKILFNVNDFFHAEMYHLAATHMVGEIVHEAAMRTLSDDHPVMALLERIMIMAYAPRLFSVGTQLLFNPGGLEDQGFFINSTGCMDFITDFYPTAGAFQSNYLEVGLQASGLLGPATQPALKSFPFYEDASTIRNVILQFMTSFVNAYYANDVVVASDSELQAWFVEANGPAKVIDFPCSPSGAFHACGKADLIAILTHTALLTGVIHHALNTGDMITTSGTLPFHPFALHAPLPTTKGLNITQLLTYLPGPADAIFQLDLLSVFNRPQYAAQNRTLVHAYNDASFLSQFNEQVTVAEAGYRQGMETIGAEIRGRGFDAEGLSQGMPFVWKNLDPGTVPYFFAV